MQLVLSVGSKVLDKIELNPDFSKDEDYLDAQKRLLIIKHEMAILALQNEPVFYIEVHSKLNKRNQR